MLHGIFSSGWIEVSEAQSEGPIPEFEAESEKLFQNVGKG